MPEFIIQSGKHSGRRLLLDNSRIVIGRDDLCQIRISSNDVSRQHCLVMLTEGGWVARDLGSQNGTFVNEVQIAGESQLAPGDKLRVGPMVLELADPEANTRKRAEADKSGTTDDDIVGWLAETEEVAGSGDTTIIKAQPEEVPDDDTSETKVPPATRQTFESVAEEAADIIRRHREMLESDGE